MKKRTRTPDLEKLRRRIMRLDPQSIDRLYGLEPVWEPAAGARTAAIEFVAVLCPYCGERLATAVDVTCDEPAYIEDCEICCRPIEFAVEREPGGALRALQVRRID